jgi:phosphoglucomutase
LTISTADRLNIPLVLANDPDADRFNAAEKSAEKWHIFTGNEMGILLAHHVLQSTPPAQRGRLAMLSSAVSSKMLRAMARKEGFRHVETLTGFKWMGNRSLELEREGVLVPYAFEEAIGYMFSGIVRDKDGVAAATAFLALVAGLYSRGQTVAGLLEELYQRYCFLLWRGG